MAELPAVIQGAQVEVEEVNHIAKLKAHGFR